MENFKIIGLILIIAIFDQSDGEFDCDTLPNMSEGAIENCCSYNSLSDDDEITKECANKFGIPLGEATSSSNLPSLDDLMCFSDCVLTGEKIIQNGTVDMEKVKESVNKELSNDPELADVIIEAFRTCWKEGEEEVISLSEESNFNCPPLAGFIAQCTSTEYFKNCPASHWSDSEECNNLKEYFQNCE